MSSYFPPSLPPSQQQTLPSLTPRHIPSVRPHKASFILHNNKHEWESEILYMRIYTRVA